MPFCQKCGRELPGGSSFCPSCGAPVEKSDYRAPAEKDCPKCGAVMRAGFIVERDSPLSLYTYGAGIYWTPGEAGVAGERVAVKAYACPQCGYIEHYVRRLEKDRNIILSAPTTYREKAETVTKTVTILVTRLELRGLYQSVKLPSSRLSVGR